MRKDLLNCALNIRRCLKERHQGIGIREIPEVALNLISLANQDFANKSAYKVWIGFSRSLLRRFLALIPENYFADAHGSECCHVVGDHGARERFCAVV